MFRVVAHDGGHDLGVGADRVFARHRAVVADHEIDLVDREHRFGVGGRGRRGAVGRAGADGGGGCDAVARCWSAATGVAEADCAMAGETWRDRAMMRVRVSAGGAGAARRFSEGAQRVGRDEREHHGEDETRRRRARMRRAANR